MLYIEGKLLGVSGGRGCWACGGFAGRITLCSPSTLAPYRGTHAHPGPRRHSLPLRRNRPAGRGRRASTSPAWPAVPRPSRRRASTGCRQTVRSARTATRRPARGLGRRHRRGAGSCARRREALAAAGRPAGPLDRSSPAVRSTQTIRPRTRPRTPRSCSPWRRAPNPPRRTTARPSPPSNRKPSKATGGKAHLCRAGLIGGPGDGSDRYGYWPARFARDNRSRPSSLTSPADATQIIDVRDLAAWILTAAEQEVTGPLNAVGEPVPFGDYLEESRHRRRVRGRGAQRSGGLARGARHRLLGRTGFPAAVAAARPRRASATRSNQRRQGRRPDHCGPGRRPCADTLADERRQGLERRRKAGLAPATEARLAEELLRAADPAPPM